MAGLCPAIFVSAAGVGTFPATMPGLTRREACTLLLTLGASTVAGDAYSQTSTRAPEPKQPPRAKSGSAIPAWRTLPPTPALPAPTRSGMAAVNGTSVYYAQFGEGPPVLLLHGGLANSNYWGLQIGELAKEFSVLVMDTRGHGRSPVMSRDFSYRAFADDVAGLLDVLEYLERCDRRLERRRGYGPRTGNEACGSREQVVRVRRQHESGRIQGGLRQRLCRIHPARQDGIRPVVAASRTMGAARSAD